MVYLFVTLIIGILACYAMLVVGTNRSPEEQRLEDEEQWKIINSPAYRAKKRQPRLFKEPRSNMHV